MRRIILKFKILSIVRLPLIFLQKFTVLWSKRQNPLSPKPRPVNLKAVRADSGNPSGREPNPVQVPANANPLRVSLSPVESSTGVNIRLARGAP